MKYGIKFQYTILICASQNNVQSTMMLLTISQLKNTLYVELSFNPFMHEHVKYELSPNLFIRFFSSTKHYLQRIGHI